MKTINILTSFLEECSTPSIGRLLGACSTPSRAKRTLWDRSCEFRVKVGLIAYKNSLNYNKTDKAVVIMIMKLKRIKYLRIIINLIIMYLIIICIIKFRIFIFKI